MENATKIPEDIKSSKLVNGTKVEIKVIDIPATSVPFLRFPVASTWPKNDGFCDRNIKKNAEKRK
jgi:hypothetical protein